MGLICSHSDPNNRPTIYEYLKDKININYFMSVGRLDFNSEGLMIMTNDGELKRYLELPEN